MKASNSWIHQSSKTIETLSPPTCIPNQLIDQHTHMLLPIIQNHKSRIFHMDKPWESNEEEDFKAGLSKLIKDFQTRGYKESILQEHFAKVSNIDRKQLLTRFGLCNSIYVDCSPYLSSHTMRKKEITKSRSSLNTTRFYLTSEMFLKVTGTYCKPMKNWQKLLKINQ